MRSKDFTLRKTLVLNGIFTLLILVSINIQAQVAYYPFNGNSIDESGNNKNGTFNDPINRPVPTTDRFGTTNSAYLFDGIDDYIVLPTSENILGSNPNEWSVSCWALPTDLTKELNIVSDNYSSSYDNYIGFHIAIVLLNSQICGSWRNSITGSHQSYDLYSGVPCEENKWYFIVVTASKVTGYLSLYINGSLVKQATFNTAADYIENVPAAIGSSKWQGAYTHFFKGKIDDVGIYNTALSSQQITSLFEEGGWGTFYKIEGTVKNSVNQTIIADASIVIIDKTTDAIISTTKSDSQGLFSIDINETQHDLMLSVSKYDPIQNLRYVTKNIDTKATLNSVHQIELTQIKYPIISGWLPSYSDEAKSDINLQKFLKSFPEIFNQISPCLYDLNDISSGISFNDIWQYPMVNILHDKKIQVIPTLGYMYDSGENKVLLNELFNNVNEDTQKNLQSVLISNIENFVITNGLDGFDIDFESFTALNKSGYTEFILELQKRLEFKNKILISTIQVPYTNGGMGKIYVNDSNYCFDYKTLMDSLHNIRLMCYDMEFYFDFPHSQCPIFLPDCLSNLTFSNNQKFKWQPSLNSLINFIMDIKNEKNLDNIIFALPTYGRNFIYDFTLNQYPDKMKSHEAFYYADLEKYISLESNIKEYVNLFGGDPIVRPNITTPAANYNCWYQDKKSLESRFGFLNSLPQKPAGIALWEVSSCGGNEHLTTDMAESVKNYKNNTAHFEYNFKTIIYLDLEYFASLPKSQTEVLPVKLEIISPSGRIVNHVLWDNFLIDPFLSFLDSAFYEEYYYGDTVAIQITDFYPEEGDYKLKITNENTNAEIKVINLTIINENDTSVFFEDYKLNDLISDTITVYRDEEIVSIENISTNDNYATLEKFEPSYEIYPNPFENIFYLKSKQSLNSILNVKVFDTSGRIVYEGNFQKEVKNEVLAIDLSSVNKGLYILQASSLEGIYTYKILKTQ